MDDFDDIVQEFLVESHENLDQLDRDLVALEQDPSSRDKLSSIFRTIHTIKGTSGFLAFSRLEKVTHAGESLLSRLRDGAQQLDGPSTDVLLRMVDTVRMLLTTIENNGSEGEVDIDSVIAAVQSCIRDDSAPATRPAPAAPAAQPAATPAAAPAPAPAADTAPAPTTPAATPAAAPAGAAEHPAEEPTSRRAVADSSIRVDVDLLDGLMRLVGELVLTRNQIVRAVDDANDPGLARTTQRLDLITSELQESVMKTRMQPIEHLWSKLPRVVRDLSNALGRKVRLAMEGGDTELDRSLLESVKDPLTHLVRNAVDHGIEPPAERTAKGKNPEGVLGLRAFHEGGHVIVEIRDDGAGIDPAKVGAVALKRGIITQTQLDRMTEEEIIALVFQAGFSTAEKVSNVSGRGVGMDVVRTNIEAIGGRVDVESDLGVGTTWRLTIPLTLAIIQALTVESGTQRYVIPQVAVRELVFVEASSAAVQRISNAPVYRLRGKLLPLVRLDEALGYQAAGGADRDVYVAVLQADGRRFGLVVDRVLNTEEVVVKPLSSRLKDIGAYAGATILGDGAVALILDVQALARRSRLTSVDRAEQAELDKQAESTTTVDRLLITGVGDRRVAIPLDLVTRLEEFPVSSVERVGSREVVQYRNQILPLMRLSALLGTYSEVESETLPAIVYSEGGHSVALAVDQILDIVEDKIEARSELDDDGLTGSAVIQQRVTELLDVRRAILAADPRFFSDPIVTDSMLEV